MSKSTVLVGIVLLLWTARAPGQLLPGEDRHMREEALRMHKERVSPRLPPAPQWQPSTFERGPSALSSLIPDQVAVRAALSGETDGEDITWSDAPASSPKESVPGLGFRNSHFLLGLGLLGAAAWGVVLFGGRPVVLARRKTMVALACAGWILASVAGYFFLSPTDRPALAPRPYAQDVSVAEAQALLAHANPYYRLKAIHSLQRLGPNAAAALPALIQALDDENPYVEEAAAEAIASLGPVAAEAVPALLRIVTDQSHYSKVLNVNLLARIGEPAVPALVGLLAASKSTEWRYQHGDVLEALRKIKAASRIPTEDLLTFLQTDYQMQAALELLVERGEVSRISKEDRDRLMATPTSCAMVREAFMAVRPELRGISGLMHEFGNKANGYFLEFLFQGASAEQIERAVAGAVVPGLITEIERLWQARQMDVLNAGSNLHDLLKRLVRFRSTPAVKAAVPILRTIISSEKGWPTHDAVMTLAQCGDEGVAALLELAEGAKVPVTDAAAAFCQAGPMARKAIPFLIRELERAEDRVVQVYLLDALSSTGDPAVLPALMKAGQGSYGRHDMEPKAAGFGAAAVPYILEGIREERAAGRPYRSLMAGLARLGPAAAAAVPELITRLNPREIDVGDVVATLAAIGPAAKPALPSLEKLFFEQTDINLRLLVLSAVVAVGGDLDFAMPEIRQLLVSDQTQEIRWHALARLASKQGGHSDVVRGLRKLIERGDPDMRGNAALSLPFSAGPGLIPHLLEALKDEPNPRFRVTALALFHTFGPKARSAGPAVVALCRSKNIDVARAAVLTLWSLGLDDDTALHAFVSALDSSDQETRICGAVGLSRFEDRAALAIPKLITLGGEEPFRCRLAAAFALASIGPDAKPALPFLVECLSREGELREVAALALGNIGPDVRDAVPALVKALRHQDGAEGYVMVALVNVGAPAAAALCEELLGGESSAPSKAAAVLSRMGKPAISALLTTRQEHPRLSGLVDTILLDMRRHGKVARVQLQRPDAR